MKKIGIHLNQGNNNNLIDAFKFEFNKAAEYGLQIKYIQIFGYGPRNYNMNLNDNEVAFLKNKCIIEDTNNKKVKVFIHKAYVSTTIKNEINIANKINADGLVVHIPAKSLEEVIQWAAEINDVTTSTSATIAPATIVYLEHKVSKNYKYTDLENFITLIEAIIKQYNNINIGICIDTCHIFASGIDIDFIKYIKTIKKLKLPLLIHLNDSKSKFASNLDRHSPLGTNIWKDNKTNFKLLFDYIINKKIPFIMENKSNELDTDYKFIQKYS